MGAPARARRRPGLAAAAVTWGAPEAQSWSAALFERGGAFLAAFLASGGPWRWLGIVIIAAALVVAAKLKAPVHAADPKDRKLNWNR